MGAALLTPAEMDKALRTMMQHMVADNAQVLTTAHKQVLKERFGLNTCESHLLRSWQPSCLAAEVDGRLPSTPEPLRNDLFDAIFVPVLNWKSQVIGAATYDVRPDGRGQVLTFGRQQFPPRGGSCPSGGFTALRFPSPQPGDAEAGYEVAELPLHVARPVGTAGQRWVGVCQGTLKAMTAAQAFGVPVLAGSAVQANAQLYKSPVQLLDFVRQATTDAPGGSGDDCPIVLLADAGSTSRPDVALHYFQTLRLLEDWGYTARVGWWGQEQRLTDGGPGHVHEMLRTARGGLAASAEVDGEEEERPCVLAEDVMSLLTLAEFRRKLSTAALRGVDEWQRSTSFVSMPEIVQWEHTVRVKV